jgi:hypothetical protein
MTDFEIKIQTSFPASFHQTSKVKQQAFHGEWRSSDIYLDAFPSFAKATINPS